MFSSMFTIVLFLIPILTMKLLSEEKKNRTDQGLLTAPVGLWSIVLGKYFAALTLFVIAESVVFIYSIILAYLGDVVWSTLLGNYFAMLFLGSAFIAVGLFISSLTENQMASAVASMLALFVLYLFDSLASNISNEIVRKRGVPVGKCRQMIYGYTVDKNIGFAIVDAEKCPIGTKVTIGPNDSPAVIVAPRWC